MFYTIERSRNPNLLGLEYTVFGLMNHSVRIITLNSVPGKYDKIHVCSLIDFDLHLQADVQGHIIFIDYQPQL